MLFNSRRDASESRTGSKGACKHRISWVCDEANRLDIVRFEIVRCGLVRFDYKV